jgi:hypothetical protein
MHGCIRDQKWVVVNLAGGASCSEIAWDLEDGWSNFRRKETCQMESDKIEIFKCLKSEFRMLESELEIGQKKGIPRMEQC